MSFLRYALFTVPAVLLLGTLSGPLSEFGLRQSLVRRRWTSRSFMPPGWVFGVAWTILYILLGLSLAMLLHAKGARRRGSGRWPCSRSSWLLNFAWSPVFFALHQVELGAVDHRGDDRRRGRA